MHLVTITNGTYRGEEVHNQTFEMVKDLTVGAKSTFITVRPNDVIGAGRDKIRINVRADNVAYDNKATPKVEENDEAVMQRIGERFEILDEMTKATVSGDVRAMILQGPPGVGKSFGVLKQLEQASLFNDIKNIAPGFEVIKGAMTPIGLYMTLFNYSDKDNVLVFDDADGVLYDELSLNLLKAAMDTSKKRKISWSSQSLALEKEGIPDSFEFKGSIIFITNINFDNIRSAKLQDHLAALQSRCHYVNLSIDTARDKFLRIRQIFQTGELFTGHPHITRDLSLEIMDWVNENKDKVRELSLRLPIKLAELVKVSPSNWKRMGMVTLCK